MSVITQWARKLNKSESEVISFLSNAPKKYKVYTIPKRKHGHRVIAQPTKELKKYQRVFLEAYPLPVHENSMAYKKGVSIKDNAQFHSGQRYLLKMDLENFFNSITPALFWDTWKALSPLPDAINKIWIEKLLFWCPSKNKSDKLVLSIGAPSSPLISNFCLYLFDQKLVTLCQQQEIYYTRYADDLTFSSNQKDVLFSIPLVVQNTLKHCFGRRLTINHSKTAFSSKAHNRHVTGVTITNEGKLSLGRERKRYIKHLVHQFILDTLDYDDLRHLQGFLSFAMHIEPTFLASLKVKYSSAVIKRIFEVRND